MHIGLRLTIVSHMECTLAMAFFFNHESPRRGETFVTRKITRGLSNIAQGLEKCLYLGNMDSLRDWGHAKDYVKMQWLMLQQEQPEDYVIATGVQYSVRQFVDFAASELGIKLRFEGHGVDEVGIVESVSGEDAPAVNVGDVIVAVDPRYFRPAEVETLLGDPSKAHDKLGWKPETTLQEMVVEMVRKDLEAAKKAFSTQITWLRGFDFPWSKKMTIKKRVFVAGHNGMVGSAIVRQLKNRDDIELVLRSRQEINLLNAQDVNYFFANERIDEVYLAAAKVGGIVANNTFPADFIYENILIEANIIHAAHVNDVNKIMFLGSSCIYPKFAKQTD